MAGSMDMKQVRVGQYTFKVRPSDLELFLAVNPDAVVVDDDEVPDEESSVNSHSDQAIDGVNAFVDAGLTEPQAEALIAAGYADLEAAQAASDDDLDEVDGIGPATVQKIREA